MNFLPIAINIESQRILVVGGGKVALQKIRGLARYSAKIKVVAPFICDEIKALEGIEMVVKFYDEADLDGHLLVFAATDNPTVNAQIWHDGQARRCLVNMVDNPARGDFSSPAIYKKDEVSVAVTTNGSNVKQAIRIRNIIKKMGDEGGLDEESGRASKY
jgi:precorrin-2 dehydrogenase / sirohydrochlorin ferrochelatase